jgi:cell division protein FtsL
MFNLILIILVSLIPFVVTWITSPEEIFLSNDESKTKQIFKKRVNKKLSTKGKWFIVAILLTTVFAFFQFLQNDRDKLDLKNEREKSESKISNRVDSSRKVLFKDLSDALAKQNLLFDSAQKRIEKLVRDSTSRVTNYIQQETQPQVSLCLGDSSIRVEQIRANGLMFRLRVCGYNNTAKKVRSIAYIVGAKQGQYHLLKKQTIISNETLLSFEDNVVFIPVENTNGINIFFFYVEYEFENTKGKKITNTDVGQFTLSTGISGKANAEFKNQILQFLKK